MPHNTYGPSFKLTLLSSLPPASALTPPRVRFVGRVIGADLPRDLLLVEDDGAAVCVEMELARRAAGREWNPPGVKEEVMVWAEVGRVETPVAPPSITAVLPSPTPPSIDPLILLKATRILPCEELDLHEWRDNVRSMLEMAP
ncbi:hypothetical protein JCM8547_002564 [Rhodosporidiobolus lusitaniae]